MKKIFTYTMLFALALSATARERSYEEKCRIASSILGTQTANKAKAADGTKSSAMLTTLDQATGYTVIGYEQGGFAIVSNDDARTPVIGYSTTDKFDATQPALAWYLDNANAAMQAGTTRAVSAASIPEGCKASVDALLGGIIWNQMGNPYVDLCPIVLDKDVNCVVGCEAVAMAQIMAYHKYPTQGTGGSNTVKFNGMPYTVYFDDATYNWDNMLDAYTSNGTYTAAQRLFIGRLMYHCGVAAGMSYGQSGSGVYTKNAAAGMAKYFGYKVKRYGYKGDKGFTDSNEWYSVIYKELSLGNPILYSGSSTKTSTTNPYIHAFVLDGYDADGKVHVNWGYSGQGNGFFDPTVLNMTINGQTEEFTGYNDMAIIRTPDSDDIHYFEGSVGINSATVDETDANAPKYSVDGMKVDDSYKGVYIQNGKKYIAK